MNLDAVGVFRFEGADFTTIALIVGNRKSVLEGQRTMACEAQRGKAVGDGELYHLTRRSFAVTVARVRMIIRKHRPC